MAIVLAATDDLLLEFENALTLAYSEYANTLATSIYELLFL